MVLPRADAGGEHDSQAPPSRPRRARRVQVGHARIDCVTVPGAVGRICSMVHDGRRSQLVVTPNIQHIVELDRNPAFRAAYDSAALVLADGWPVAAAARLAGATGQGRASGADLLPAVCEAARDRGFSVGFVGGPPGAAERCAGNLTARYPGLRVVLVHEPPMGFHLVAEQRAEVLAAIAGTRPDILFLGLGAPKQELFSHQYLPDAAVVVGVGAAIEFAAGIRRRAPGWVQRAGLEWLFRLALEPRRLWRRYAMSAPRFVPVLVEASRRRQASGTQADASGPAN